MATAYSLPMPERIPDTLLRSVPTKNQDMLPEYRLTIGPDWVGLALMKGSTPVVSAVTHVEGKSLPFRADQIRALAKPLGQAITDWVKLAEEVSGALGGVLVVLEEIEVSQ